MRTALLALLAVLLTLGLLSAVRRQSSMRPAAPQAPVPLPTGTQGVASKPSARTADPQTTPDSVQPPPRTPTIGASLVGRSGLLPTSAIAASTETVTVNRPFLATAMTKADDSTLRHRFIGFAGGDIYYLPDTIVAGSSNDRLVVTVDSAGLVRCISQNVFLRFRPFYDTLTQWIGRMPDSSLLYTNQSMAFWWNDTLLVTLTGDRSGYIINSWLKLQRIPRRDRALPALFAPC